MGDSALTVPRCLYQRSAAEIARVLRQAQSGGAFADACQLVSGFVEHEVNAMMGLVVKGCPKAARERHGGSVALTTKLACLMRLARCGYPLFERHDVKVLGEVRGWCLDYAARVLGQARIWNNDAFAELARWSLRFVEALRDLRHAVCCRAAQMCSGFELPALAARQCRCVTRCIKEVPHEDQGLAGARDGAA